MNERLDEIMDKVDELFYEQELYDLIYNIVEYSDDFEEFESDLNYRLENDYDGRVEWILTSNFARKTKLEDALKCILEDMKKCYEEE